MDASPAMAPEIIPSTDGLPRVFHSMAIHSSAPALAATLRSPTDLLKASLIQSDNKMLRWPHWFEANGLPAPPVQGIRFDRSFLAIAAAADGLGVAGPAGPAGACPMTSGGWAWTTPTSPGTPNRR